MTPVDIDKLKELLAKASAAPWQLYIPDDGSGAAVIKRNYEVEGGARITDWPAVCNCGTLPNADNAALIVSLVNAAPTLIAKAERVDALDWLSDQTQLELHHYSPVYGDDDDQAVEWRVTEVSGPINDREWTTVGRGETALDAILSARNALSPKESEK